jgi:hypothetical protein
VSHKWYQPKKQWITFYVKLGQSWRECRQLGYSSKSASRIKTNSGLLEATNTVSTTSAKICWTPNSAGPRLPPPSANRFSWEEPPHKLVLQVLLRRNLSMVMPPNFPPLWRKTSKGSHPRMTRASRLVSRTHSGSDAFGAHKPSHGSRTASCPFPVRLSSSLRPPLFAYHSASWWASFLLLAFSKDRNSLDSISRILYDNANAIIWRVASDVRDCSCWIN